MATLRAAVVVAVVVIVASMVIVDGKRGEHRMKNESRRRQDKKKAAVPKEFAKWHAYNKRFLEHISTQPSQLLHQDLKPHLNTLLVDLDFLPQVNSYVDAHLTNVSTAEQARRVYTLLDLYSAQEPLRQRYLQLMRETLVKLFEKYPQFVKQPVPTKFIIDGFDRHVKEMKRRTRELYR